MSKDIIEELKESANKIWLAGLGALSMTDKEGSNFFKELVKKGQNFETIGLEQVQKAKDNFSDKVKEAKDNLNDKVKEAKDNLNDKVKEAKTKAGDLWEKIEGTIDVTKVKAKNQAEGIWERLEEVLDDKVSTILNRFGVPSGEEISNLTKRVEELTAIVEKLKSSTTQTSGE